MTAHATTTVSPPPRRLWRSTGAVFLGFLAVFVLSLGTDQVFHVLAVYPPWGEPMREPGLNLLALSYRLVYDTLGSYITAWFAPRNPMRHVWVGAVIGLVLSSSSAGPSRSWRAWHSTTKPLPTLSFSQCCPASRRARDERNFVKKASWALRAIGERNPALNVAALTVSRRLSRSEKASC